MEQVSRESFKVGKVKVERLTPTVFKLSMIGIWWWYSGGHYTKAIARLSEEYKIVSVVSLISWFNFLVVIVEEK